MPGVLWRNLGQFAVSVLSHTPPDHLALAHNLILKIKKQSQKEKYQCFLHQTIWPMAVAPNLILFERVQFQYCLSFGPVSQTYSQYFCILMRNKETSAFVIHSGIILFLSLCLFSFILTDFSVLHLCSFFCISLNLDNSNYATKF